jgi:hypothetical protein
MSKFPQDLPDLKQLIAVLKVIALGEKDRLENKGLTVEESRAQLRTTRQRLTLRDTAECFDDYPRHTGTIDLGNFYRESHGT